MTFIPVTFGDGQVTVDRLQRMSDNDEFLYSAAIAKPRGLIGLVERTTSYANPSSGYDNLFDDDLIITPYADNRLIAIFVYLPKYGSTAAGVLGSTRFQFMKDGIAIQTGYTDKKYFSGASGDETSVYHGVLDFKPVKFPHVFNIQIECVATAGDQILTLDEDRPAQLWAEDLGALS